MKIENNILDAVWATDENYVFLAGVSIASMLENNRSFEKVRVWILADHISEKSKKHLTECVEQYGRDIEFLDVEKYIDKIKQTGARRWGRKESYSAYSRLFIADIMEDYGVTKVIYCDCDLIIDGSLHEIWNIALGGGKTLGMVKEYNRVELRDLLRLSRDECYYQSGFLLIDIDNWKKQKCTQRLLEHMKYVSAVYPFVDQDLINCVLHNEIYSLPIQYNVNPRAMQYSYKELAYIYGLNEKNYYSEKEFNAGIRNGHKPVIYHCSDPCSGKPWEIGNHHVFTEKWEYYYKRSIWYKLYSREEYRPNNLSKIQYWLNCHLSKRIYIIILKYSSKIMMKKLVKKYIDYQKESV